MALGKLRFSIAVALMSLPLGAGCTEAPRHSVTPSPSPSAVPSASPSPTPIFSTVPSFDNPETIATHLTTAETAIRDSATRPSEMPMLGRVQQAAYRKLVERSDWRETTYGLLPEHLVPIAKANLGAGAELRALTKPVEKLPPWNIVEPPPLEELRTFYKEAEAEFGIPWAYLASIHLVESRMGRIRGTSSAGAQGPMQFLPGTWARYGKGDINDPRDSVFAAARYLKAAGGPADMPKALYAYNHSDRYVHGITVYAQQMLADEKSFLGYYHWQVYVRTVNGDVLLEVGYPAQD